MLELLPAPDDVIALTVSGKVTGADLDAIMNRLDGLMARDGKVHVFVETLGIEGIEVSGLPSYTARAWPLFGQLDRFGRVAVVADQAWVRAGTRLESALLPNISYRTFLPEEREEAWAWVTAKA
jgi:hypothetical protein